MYEWDEDLNLNLKSDTVNRVIFLPTANIQQSSWAEKYKVKQKIENTKIKLCLLPLVYGLVFKSKFETLLFYVLTTILLLPLFGCGRIQSRIR